MLGGEFGKKGKPGHLAKPSPVSACSFPLVFAQFQHKTGPPDQHLALRRKRYRRQLLLFNAVAKRLFRSQVEVICHLA